MIAIVYIGQRRFQETTKQNHKKFLTELSKEFKIKIYDFIKDAPDPACPYDRSGTVQVWDFVHAIEKVQEEIVIKLRTDVWFTDSSIKIIMQELRKIHNNSLDLAYIGINLRHHYDKEYYIENALNSKKVMDFIIIANKVKLRSSTDILERLTNSDKEASGNKFFRLLITSNMAAISVSCQLYLVRKEYANPENWQILNDWAAEYRKTDSGLDWMENSRDIINKF
jgi:hypothetical protein